MDGRTKSILALTLSLAAAMASIWIAKTLFGTYIVQRSLTAIEVLTLGQLVVLAFGLGSVVLLWIQTRNESQWKRLLSYHQYFSDCPASQARKDMLETMQKLGHVDHLDGSGTPLDAADIDSIVTDSNSRQKVVVYLDGFEQLSGAINAGIVDKDYAYDLDAARLLRIYRIFAPLVAKVRTNSPRAYDQFECLAEEWLDRRTKDLQKKRQANVKNRAPK